MKVRKWLAIFQVYLEYSWWFWLGAGRKEMVRLNRNKFTSPVQVSSVGNSAMVYRLIKLGLPWSQIHAWLINGNKPAWCLVAWSLDRFSSKIKLRTLFIRSVALWSYLIESTSWNQDGGRVKQMVYSFHPSLNLKLKKHFFACVVSCGKKVSYNCNNVRLNLKLLRLYRRIKI